MFSKLLQGWEKVLKFLNFSWFPPEKVPPKNLGVMPIRGEKKNPGKMNLTIKFFTPKNVGISVTTIE